jgi:hypothetical protein
MATGSIKSVEGFKDLFELDSHLDKMKGMEIEDIVQKVVTEVREIQQQRKVVHLQTRRLNQVNQTEVSDSKAEAQRKCVGAIYDAASVVLSVAGAATGLTPLEVFARGFDKASDQSNRVNQADIQSKDHVYTLLGSTINELSQQVHGSDKDSQQAHDLLDRIMNSRQRLIESITSAA